MPAANPPKVPLATNVIPSIEYVYPGVPFVPVTVTLPVLPPLQSTLVCELMIPATAVAGCVMVTETVEVHPLASFTVMVYTPAIKLLKVPLT